MDDLTIDFLAKVGIDCTLLVAGTELRLDRDAFMHVSTYDAVAVMIPDLKKRYSSSSMTALQKNAKDNQKWPLLNLTRQVLKCCGYCMKPCRISAGRDIAGKKVYKRSFIISSASHVTES
jgi:hypothetical protein